MDKHENPTTKIERNQPPEAQSAHPLYSPDLHVGIDAMARLMPRTPIDDGFSIVDGNIKHTADGNIKHTADGNIKHTADGNIKHTADGKPSAPDQAEDHMKQMTAVPNQEPRIGSTAWIAQHAKPGEEDLGKPPKADLPLNAHDRDLTRAVLIDNPYAKPIEQGGDVPGSYAWLRREKDDYIANVFKNGNSGDASRAPVAAPDTGDPVKEHHSLPNKFVHKWSSGPLADYPVEATPRPIVLRGPNEDVTQPKKK